MSGTERPKPHGVIMRELFRRRPSPPKRTDLVPASPAEVIEALRKEEEESESPKNILAIGRSRVVTETEFVILGQDPETIMQAPGYQPKIKESRFRRLFNRLRLERRAENERPQLPPGS